MEDFAIGDLQIILSQTERKILAGSVSYVITLHPWISADMDLNVGGLDMLIIQRSRRTTGRSAPLYQRLKLRPPGAPWVRPQIVRSKSACVEAEGKKESSGPARSVLCYQRSREPDSTNECHGAEREGALDSATSLFIQQLFRKNWGYRSYVPFN
jgi:hypothetical protein